MYCVVVIVLFIILFILMYIIYRENIEIKRQKSININLLKDNKILTNIDKYQIDYLKNGYVKKKYKGKILLGDYDKHSMSNTVEVINKLGYDVDIVSNSTDLLCKLKLNKYDYIITNYLYKEGMDGIELCNVIKYELKINIPIIILSSSNDMKEKFMCVADYYIEKPLTQNKLRKVITHK